MKIVQVSFILLNFFLMGFSKEIRLPNMEPHYVLDIAEFFLPRNPVILDAGAYDGASDIPLMKKKWPDCVIHAFEPVPEIYMRLLNTTKNFDNIFTYHHALADYSGSSIFYESHEESNPEESFMSGSLLRPKEHINYAKSVEFDNEILVDVISAKDWIEQEEIDHIDFLWLDMQGYELPTLKDFPKEILSNVKVIYSEVEFVEAYEGQSLYKELDTWLQKQGFSKIAKDFISPKHTWFGNCIYVNNKLLKKNWLRNLRIHLKKIHKKNRS